MTPCPEGEVPAGPLFHVKHLVRPPRLALLMLLALTVISLGAAGCGRIASPRGWASPVLADGLLLVAHRDRLFALDPESLDARWAFPPGDDDVDPIALYGTPGMSDGTVLIPTYEGTLYGVAADSGEAAWTPFETDGPLVGGVTVAQDTAYFGSSDGRVYALDVKTGQPRWRPFKTGDAVWSAPALVGDTLYVTSLDGRLYTLDAATGAERWSFKTDAGIASPPVVNEEAGLVYVAGFDSRLRAIDLNTRQERWSLKAGNWFWTRPLLAGGALYAGSLDGEVYAVDARTGARLWVEPFSTGVPVHAAPLLVDGVLIIVDRDGNVYGIDRVNGSAAVAAPLALEADVLADPLLLPNGRVAVVTTEGELVQVDATALQVVERRKLTGD